VRLSEALGVQSGWAMTSRTRTLEEVGSAELAVRLHDASTCLALAIGFLRESPPAESIHRSAGSHPVALLEDALANLRSISAGMRRGGVPPSRPSWSDELAEHATRLGIRLSISILGSTDWLSPAHSELIRLAGREALMNTSRHSGARACEVTLDASRCPYLLQAHDWGAGIGAHAREGGGLVRLHHLAAWLGSELTVASRRGLGAEIRLKGPICPGLAALNRSRCAEEASS